MFPLSRARPSARGRSFDTRIIQHGVALAPIARADGRRWRLGVAPRNPAQPRAGEKNGAAPPGTVPSRASHIRLCAFASACSASWMARHSRRFRAFLESHGAVSPRESTPHESATHLRPHETSRARGSHSLSHSPRPPSSSRQPGERRRLPPGIQHLLPSSYLPARGPVSPQPTRPRSRRSESLPPSGYSMVTFVTFAFFSSCFGTSTVRTPPSIFAEIPSLAASFRYTPRVACHSEVSFCR